MPKLIVYDFDGVMTDNKVIIDQNGTEYVTVNRGDGFGVRMIKDELEIPQVILSTEVNSVVARRAEKLGIPAIHGVGDKKSILTQYCLDNKFNLNEVMFIGNDLNDYDAMQLCGMKACPADAEHEIISISDIVFTAKGGCGVIRELYRVLTRCEDE